MSVIEKSIDSKRGNISKLLFEGGWEVSFMEKSDATKFVVCVSSQKGCPMKCTFCHLTDKGMYKNCRNLYANEIAMEVQQTLFYKKEQNKLPSNRDCLVSFMAMGEPLLNINNILSSIPLIEERCSYLIDGKFRYDISTVFPKGKTLDKIPEDLNIRIFYSLHSPFDNIREKLMPNTESIDYAFRELVKYYGRTGIKPIVHYTFIDGVNDSDEEVEAIIDLMTKPEHQDFQLRILRYNPYDKDTQRESRKLLDIIEKLEEHMYVKLHRSPGYDIQAACGQFICE